MGRTLYTAFAFLLLLSSSANANARNGDVAFSKGDYASAYREWQQSAGSGDASAMLGIGTLYDTGHGVPQDFAQALAWYRRAAGAGNVRAMLNVATMYDNGRGTAASRTEAMKWYGMAARKGNGRAAYNLGVIYRDGDGVSRDPAAAIRFFRIAAAAGIEAARSNLTALGAAAASLRPPQPASPTPGSAAPAAMAAAAPPVNSMPWIDAFRRFQDAALAHQAVDPVASDTFIAMLPTIIEKVGQGDGLAQYDIGYAYEHGQGMPRDLVEAYVYYMRAATSRASDVIQPALDAASAVAPKLTKAEYAKAVDELLAGPPF